MIKKIFSWQKQLDGMTARPVGPYSRDGLSENMVMPRPNRDGIIFGSLSNWENSEEELLFNPALWNIHPGQTITLVDHWSGERWETNGPKLLPPTAPRHMSIRQYEKYKI